MVPGGDGFTVCDARHAPVQSRDPRGQPVRQGLRRSVSLPDLAVRQVGRRRDRRPTSNATWPTGLRSLADSQRVLAGAPRKSIRQVCLLSSVPTNLCACLDFLTFYAVVRYKTLFHSFWLSPGLTLLRLPQILPNDRLAVPTTLPFVIFSAA